MDLGEKAFTILVVSSFVFELEYCWILLGCLSQNGSFHLSSYHHSCPSIIKDLGMIDFDPDPDDANRDTSKDDEDL